MSAETKKAAIQLEGLNRATREGFLSVCGPLFEHSPWIAERTWSLKPFASLTALHRALVSTMENATEEEKLGLIRAHPDLVGRMARDPARDLALGELSSREQAAAGLDELSAEESRAFLTWNRAYRERFGFPFVICARENRKESILRAFPERLRHAPEAEIRTALAEIAKIAWLRLNDAVTEER